MLNLPLDRDVRYDFYDKMTSEIHSAFCKIYGFNYDFTYEERWINIIKLYKDDVEMQKNASYVISHERVIQLLMDCNDDEISKAINDVKPICNNVVFGEGIFGAGID